MKTNSKYPPEKPKYWIWIVLGIIVVSGIGLTAYFVSRSSSSDEQKSPEQTHSLPSHEEAQKKIAEIKSAKGLDDQQATIEFLAHFVPKINWWEINDLHEMDEKIKLVNSKCKFPPLKEVPNNQHALDEFNAEWGSNCLYRNLAFLASICPRKSDGSIDWKGKNNFADYFSALKPELESYKFKPSFAIVPNYRMLNEALVVNANSELADLCSEFATLSTVEELNKLVDRYLGKILRACVCASIHDDLGKQLSIPNHAEHQLQLSGNNTTNHNWGVFLYGYKLGKKTS